MKKIALYITLGYPNEERFFATLDLIEKYNIDFVEIGIPANNPVQDGDFIKQAHEIVYNESLGKEYLSRILQLIRDKYSFKVILMTYYEGMKQFDIINIDPNLYDGVLCSDKTLFNPNINKPVYVYNSQNSEDEIASKLSENVEFCYIQSHVGKTGMQFSASDNLTKLIYDIKDKSNLPCFIGFGIKNNKDIENALKLGADGVIIGTEFMKQVANGNDYIDSYLKQITET